MVKQYGESDKAVLCDEMKTKEGILYEWKFGMIIVYADIDVESVLSVPPGEHQIATYALVFMIRGRRSNLKLTAVSYTTSTATAGQII